MDVTLSPACLSSTPILELVMPLPRPDTTPPVTATYFIWRAEKGAAGESSASVERPRRRAAKGAGCAGGGKQSYEFEWRAGSVHALCECRGALLGSVRCGGVGLRRCVCAVHV